MKGVATGFSDALRVKPGLSWVMSRLTLIDEPLWKSGTVVFPVSLPILENRERILKPLSCASGNTISELVSSLDTFFLVGQKRSRPSFVALVMHVSAAGKN